MAAFNADDPVVPEEEDEEEEGAEEGPTPAGWTRCPRIASSRAQGRAPQSQPMECIEIPDSDDE